MDFSLVRTENSLRLVYKDIHFNFQEIYKKVLDLVSIKNNIFLAKIKSYDKISRIDKFKGIWYESKEKSITFYKHINDNDVLFGLCKLKQEDFENKLEMIMQYSSNYFIILADEELFSEESEMLLLRFIDNQRFDLSKALKQTNITIIRANCMHEEVGYEGYGYIEII